MTQLNAHKSKYFDILEQWECAGRDVGWDFMAIFQTFAASFESWNCKHLLFRVYTKQDVCRRTQSAVNEKHKNNFFLVK